MYYHASPFGGITQLKPHVSNHGIPLVYFSKKRENGLSVYYISIVLLTKEGKVDTLLFEFNKMYNH